MTDSDEDVPLGQRNQAFLFGKAKPIVVSSDDDSPLPSWLDAPRPAPDAAGGAAPVTDSDSDIKEVISPPKLLSPSKHPGAAATAPQGEAGPSAPPAQEPAAATQQEEKPAPPSAGKKAPTPKKKAATPKKAAAGAAATAAPAPAARSGLAGPSSSVTVTLPERLTQAKVLLELESAGDGAHGATDLSGDSGAIGRVIVSGQPGARQLQIDLKGVLYNATVVPAPVTMAVVNIGPAEAKVEALFDEFVQLREDARFAEAQGAGAFGGMLDDDDDDEHYGGEGDGDGGAPGKKEGAKKRGAGRGRGGGAAGKGAAGKGAAAARKPRAGGVKKPAARGRGKAKK